MANADGAAVFLCPLDKKLELLIHEFLGLLVIQEHVAGEGGYAVSGCDFARNGGSDGAAVHEIDRVVIEFRHHPVHRLKLLS